jgi:hypothetical protein
MDVVFKEFSIVGRTVGPEELTMAVLLTIAVLSFIASVVRPDLLAVTVLLIFEPVTFVTGTISVMIFSVTMGFIVLPFSVVDITVSVDKSATTICLVGTPISFIQTTVDPDLNSAAVFATKLVPFSLILGSIVESHKGALHANDTIGSGCRLKVEGFEGIANLHDKLTCLQDLLV